MFNQILIISGYVIAGILAVVGIFNRQTKLRKVEDDNTASNLIANLKTTTEVQEKELVSLRAKEVEQGKEIAHLQGEVKTLTAILQGKDPSMVTFFREAPQLMEMTKQNNIAITNLTNTMESFLKQIMPSVEKRKQTTTEPVSN